MTEEEQILTLLQHGDSFFPSGAVSFSWGLEMLNNDHVITSTVELNQFIENQLIERWGPFERVVLAHTYDYADDIVQVISIDKLVECMTLSSELREGSKRLGSALLTTYQQLNNPIAEHYLKLSNEGKALGHLPITQALIWASLGLSRNSVLMLSAYNFCVSVLGAALRLGIVGHIDCQKSLTTFRQLITEILTWPIPDIEEIHAFTPFADIASMRHENSETRLFAN
ncbi:MAG: urease accessory protein UreF [Gammaproteobacteria bacterium]|nr:urease accessory protein UreF [Gammaproteobacteria bacterium]